MDNRYDFVFLFDVLDGNPNGDPDAGNLPRVDPESGHGLVTDVCLKRKIRNYIGLTKGETPPHEIYVKEQAVLNLQHTRAYEGVGKKPSKNVDAEAKAWMCRNFYDIRAFGAVMTTQINCGQVRGAVQMTFSRSIDPIVSLEHAITRCAVTTEKESIAQEGGNRTMGRKFTVPYALYRCHGFVNPFLADQTGFSHDDLTLFWEAMKGMFELDRSATRGQMTPRGLVAFRHDSKLGNARADELLDRVRITRGGDSNQAARSFADYNVSIDVQDLPEGVTIEQIL